jgi:serine/threonine protein kinase
MWGPTDGDTGEAKVGDALGPYQLESVLGEGGVGKVFKAMRVDGLVVALKVLKRKLSADESYKRRFVHEARAAREVQHKYLAAILDAGEANGFSYLAVQYVAGRSLAERIKQGGPLSMDELLRLTAEVGSGLDALHAKGLIHRDIKPSNIMLDSDGSAVLTDFGLARGPAYTRLTKPGQVMGTLDYLAPELITGKEASPASDIYALGCVVYEAVSGAAPFAHKSVVQVAMSHLEEDPPDPLLKRDDLPAPLSWPILQALQKEPAKRPPTATAYANLLRLAGRPSTR